MADGGFDLLVTQVALEAEGIVSLRLEDPCGGELPEWGPGAHIDVVLPSGLIRQYSLCADPEERRFYRIAVFREADGKGRGGSEEVHGAALVGRTVQARGPRNHFKLVDAPSYLFIAGGIGITPILPMIRQVVQAGADWQLAYGGRSRRTMAFVDELGDYPRERITIDEGAQLDLDRIFSTADPQTQIYCCGPDGLLKAVEQQCEGRDLLTALHFERFTAAGEPTAHIPEDSGSFRVRLDRSGVELTVPPDRTILEVVEEFAPDASSSCQEGYCGTCETTVLEGTPEHRDSILSPEERDEGKTMMICVGRSKSPMLVLDL